MHMNRQNPSILEQHTEIQTSVEDEHHHGRERLFSVLTLVLIGAAAGGFLLVLKCVHPFGIGPWDVVTFFHLDSLQSKWKILTAPYIYLTLGITLFLEYLIPANPKQKILSASFYQDIVWFFYEAVSQALIISLYVDGLRYLYTTHLSFLTMKSIGEWPFEVRLIVGILLTDFLFWLQHVVNHKVPWLWELHAVHHSQKEINFFTDYRYHVLEYVIRQTFLVVPFLILAVNTPTVVVVSIFWSWYTKFYHGNVRSNLGFLRYILVTPQSHRVHHSRRHEHHDQNFGSLFCFWDMIFKTQCKDYSVYPETGINDAAFPHEKERTSAPRILLMPLVQMAYPFKKIGVMIKKYLVRQ